MSRRLGKLETLFFAYAQMRQLQTVRTGELAEPMQISAKQERGLLSRLNRSGLIAKVRRGLYLVPPRLPLGGKWSPGEALALDTLMNDAGARYQICGPNAFNRYGYDQQVPNRLYVYNSGLSGERTVGSVAMTLIKVDEKRLGSTEKVRTPDGLTMIYSSRVRTLVDAVYDWSRFDSLPRGYDWIVRDLKERRVTVEELVRTTKRCSNRGTTRRIGFLLERIGIKARFLNELERAVRGSSSVIPWIPNAPKRGLVNRRWGVVFNG